MTIIKVYQLNNVTAQSILYKFYVNLKPQKWCGLSKLLEYLQMFDIKGRKREGRERLIYYYKKQVRVIMEAKFKICSQQFRDPRELMV